MASHTGVVAAKTKNEARVLRLVDELQIAPDYSGSPRNLRRLVRKGFHGLLLTPECC